MKKGHSFVHLILFLTCCFWFPVSLQAEELSGLSKGETIYVPAYSNIYAGNVELPMFLTVTISIRNIDLRHSIKVTKVDYYETQGNLLEKFIDSPIILKPLDSTHYVIPQKDKAGGSGANFIVEWKSDKPVNSPIVEAVMIAGGSNSISFTSRGQALINTD